MANFRYTLIRILKVTLISVISISLTLIFPLLLLIFGCPIFGYRFLVSRLSRILRPDLGEILNPRSAIFAVDDMYGKPRATLLVVLVLDREESIPEGQQFLLENLVNLKDPETGALARPQLQQTITTWGGFHFWIPDLNFDIKNHVFEYDGPSKASIYNETSLHEISNEIVTAPFQEDRSPWEFVLFRNVVADEPDPKDTPKFALMVRIHHALADGFSILKLTFDIITSTVELIPMQVKSEEPSPVGMRSKVMNGLKFLVKAPYELIQVLTELYDRNEWRLSESQLSRKMNGAVHDKIRVDLIKEIKNDHGVSFTAVLMAAFAGAIRRFMIEQKVIVPERIHCLAPIPVPGHSGRKLQNLMTGCWITLPLGIESPLHRLKALDQHVNELKGSSYPMLLFYLIPLAGRLFPALIKIFTKQYLVTAVMSNFPGPEKEVFYRGIPVLEIIFSGGLLPGNIGVGLASISYNGFMRIVAGVDESIVSKDVGITIKRLVQLVADELNVLKDLEPN